MADINLPDDLILPIPENQKEDDLYKTLQDFSKGVVDGFSAMEEIEAIDAGTGITDTDNVFSVNEAEVDHDALLNTHDLTTDIDHDTIANGHNLTTDINHNTILNNHNLTTDIDHDALTNFTATEHFTMLDEDDMASDSNTQTATQQSIKAYVDSNASGGFTPTDSGTFSAASSTSITETISAGETYKLVIDGTGHSSGATLGIQINSNTSANYNFYHNGNDSGGGGTAYDAYNGSQNSFQLSQNNILDTGTFHAEVYITARNSDTQIFASYKMIGATKYSIINVSGEFTVATPTSIQIIDYNGNARLTGSYYLYKLNTV